jgi:P27 family predicted phage terminase small subunit
MGKRGPKPTPTAILTARGSWRAKANPGEPRPERGMPSTPSEVREDEDAHREWRRIIPKLDAAGLLTTLDGEVLGGYCLMRAMRWRAYRALRDLRAANPGKPVEQTDTGRKVVQQIMDLAKTLRATEAEFGLTPSGRARIVLPSDRGNMHGDQGHGKETNRAPTAADFIRYGS